MTTTSPNCIRIGLLSVVMFFSGVCITILNILYSLLSLDGNFQKKISEDETLNIHVYDMKGDLILQFTDVSITTEINLQGFSKGIYMIHLNSSTGNSKIKKVSVVE